MSYCLCCYAAPDQVAAKAVLRPRAEKTLRLEELNECIGLLATLEQKALVWKRGLLNQVPIPGQHAASPYKRSESSL